MSVISTRYRNSDSEAKTGSQVGTRVGRYRSGPPRVSDRNFGRIH